MLCYTTEGKYFLLYYFMKDSQYFFMKKWRRNYFFLIVRSADKTYIISHQLNVFSVIGLAEIQVYSEGFTCGYSV